jgi:hypothetical protein
MPPNPDPRFVVGTRVHAKAILVTNHAECHRRYGSNAKSKLVGGSVVAVESLPSAKGKHSLKVITIDFDLGGATIKQLKLNLRSVKAGDVPGTTMAVSTPVTTLVTEGQSGDNGDSSPASTPPPVVLTQERTSDDDLFSSSEEEEERVVVAGGAARPRPSPPVDEDGVMFVSSGVE